MPEPEKILFVAGARPNFMKIAPILRALAAGSRRFQGLLVHTGQHYDEALSQVFFDELGLPEPDWNLEVGSGSRARQMADILTRFEPIVLEQRPAMVVVVGDVTSTIACAMVAVQLGVRVAHVEAGLRSFDRSMPEEIHRVLTDAISDLLFVSEPSGVANLAKEGVAPEKVHLVGNVMVDTLLRHEEKARSSRVLERLGLEPRAYGVLTLHRPSNVDDAETFGRILEALRAVSRELPLIFPVHPRTTARMDVLGLRRAAETTPGLQMVPPLGYLDFLRLQSSARVVLTDSGGIQEETTVLGVPCVTIRENTERPITLTEGTNVLVGTDPDRITGAALDAVRRPWTPPATPPALWDGRAAERIVAIIERAIA